jgi:hypothetical protein
MRNWFVLFPLLKQSRVFRANRQPPQDHETPSHHPHHHPGKKRCHTGHANKHRVYRHKVTSYHRPNYRTNHSYRYRVAPRPVIRFSSSVYRPVYRSSSYSSYGYGGYGYGYRPVSSLSFFFGSGGYCR